MTLASMLRRLGGRHVTIALGDGVGALNPLDDGTSVGETLTRFAAETGCVTLILGWSPVPLKGLAAEAFARIITLMPGWGVRELLIPDGARLQYGPGQVGTALLQRANKPLSIDTGLLTDAVIDLERRGLLVGQPSATYLLGSAELYNWAGTRPILREIGYTHDLTRLSRGTPFVAVNTVIEIDPVGQVNVEGVAGKVVGGIGGHPDYCAGARPNPNGLSVSAIPSRFNNRSPLVEPLSRPASTPAHDVEVVVTELGHVDLRGADWSERRRLISDLFDRAA